MFFFYFSVFAYNLGSAVLLRASLVIIFDQIWFQNNHAYRGAALRINDGSKVSLFNLLCVCACACACVCLRACVCTCTHCV